MIVDAAGQPGGSWPRHYDSLTLFSPARLSTLPGRRLPGRLSRHPRRDDMTRSLRDYATHFQLPVRTGVRVLDTSWDGEAFEVTLAGGDQLTARAVIAASGGFGQPVIPELPGATSYTGRLLHSAGLSDAEGYAGQRVVVVGAARGRGVAAGFSRPHLSRSMLQESHLVRCSRRRRVGVRLPHPAGSGVGCHREGPHRLGSRGG